VSASMS